MISYKLHLFHVTVKSGCFHLRDSPANNDNRTMASFKFWVHQSPYFGYKIILGITSFPPFGKGLEHRRLCREVLNKSGLGPAYITLPTFCRLYGDS